MKVTNNASGPRGVALANGGTHYLEPGETAEMDVAEGHSLYEGLSGDEAAEPGPLDLSVDDLTVHIAGVDDADDIQALIDAETSGKSRKGALAALEARRDELLA
jgi:hypothetical protein